MLKPEIKQHLLGKSPPGEALWILNTHAIPIPLGQGPASLGPQGTPTHTGEGLFLARKTFPPLTINFLSGLSGHGPGMS